MPATGARKMACPGKACLGRQADGRIRQNGSQPAARDRTRISHNDISKQMLRYTRDMHANIPKKQNEKIRASENDIYRFFHGADIFDYYDPAS
jgi:hypothetical protein